MAQRALLASGQPAARRAGVSGTRTALERLGGCLLLILALSTSCGPADGETRELKKLWPNGRVRTQGIEVHDDGSWSMEGRVEFFHDDGSKEAEGEYRLGLEVGHWRHWLADGTRAEGSYEAGKRVGEWTYWHENGTLQEQGQYQDGQRIGRWTWWYSTGKRREVNEYLAGKVHGLRISFDEEGQLDRAACGQFAEGLRVGPLPAKLDVDAWLAGESSD